MKSYIFTIKKKKKTPTPTGGKNFAELVCLSGQMRRYNVLDFL